MLSFTAGGDFNGDGVVTAVDYNLWREAAATGTTPTPWVDADGSGVADQGDYDIWSATYGDTRVPSTLVVNDLGDSDDGDIYNGVTTLREAVRYSNLKPWIDTITFNASLSGGTILVGSEYLADAPNVEKPY